MTETLPFQAADPAAAWNTLVAALLTLAAETVLPLTATVLEKTPVVAGEMGGVPDTASATVESVIDVVEATLKVDCRLLRLTLPVLPAVGVAGAPMEAPALLNATLLLPFAADS